MAHGHARLIVESPYVVGIVPTTHGPVLHGECETDSTCPVMLGNPNPQSGSNRGVDWFGVRLRDSNSPVQIEAISGPKIERDRSDHAQIKVGSLRLGKQHVVQGCRL